MGILIDLIAVAAQTVYEQIRNGLRTGTVDNVASYLNILAAWVEAIVNDFSWVMGEEAGAVKYSADYAKQIGHDLEQIQGDQQSNWNRLFDTILPASLKHAYGVAQQWAIVYFSPPITDLYNHVNNLDDRMTTIEEWRTQRVDPHIVKVDNFLIAFYAGDQPAINVLNEWLSRPGVFGAWAAAPVTGPVIAYLADPAHQASRDNLTAVIAGAWSEEAQRVWDDLETWLGSNT